MVGQLNARRKYILEEIYQKMQGGVDYSHTIGHLTAIEQQVLQKQFGIKISKLENGYYFLAFPKKQESTEEKVQESKEILSISDEIEELFNKMPDETHPYYPKWKDDINNLVKYCNALAGTEVYPLF